MNATAKPSARVLSTTTLSPLSLLMSCRAGRLQEPFASGQARFYYRGRYAIWRALKALQIRPSHNVAFPAFHCGTELEPFLELGIGVRFYRTTPRLQVDMDSLSGLIDGDTRAVFIIHYFGLPQDVATIQRFCQERNLLLIEDCAHALGGRHQGRWLGSFGDAAIFSMRKFVPIPDGGALLLNRRDVALPDAPARPPLRVTLGELKIKLARNLVKNLQRNPCGRALKASIISPVSAFLRGGSRAGLEEAHHDNDLYQFRKEEIGWGMSPLSEAIWRNTDCDLMVARRRTHFGFFLDHLEFSSHVKPLVDRLTEGACPWAFPILVPSIDAFIERLLARGIVVRKFWERTRPEFPKEKFPEETRLRERILTLPVHQELDAAALGMIADVVNEWVAERR